MLNLQYRGKKVRKQFAYLRIDKNFYAKIRKRKFCETKLDCKPKSYLKPFKRSAAPANEGDFWVRALFLCNSVKKQIFFLRPFLPTYISKLQYSLICDFYTNFSKYFIEVL